MRVLVACEFSGVVREAFRAKGHDAWSCDTLPAEDGSPFHIQEDVLKHLECGWDLMIAHPPCTALAVSGNRWYANTEERTDASTFVWLLWNAPINKICIENPVGVINSLLPDMPKPQYIQPWQFGHDASKKTGLWLLNLPELIPTNIIKKKRYANQTPSGQNNLGPSKDRWKLRSRTYEGIAKAMAEQWG